MKPTRAIVLVCGFLFVAFLAMLALATAQAQTFDYNPPPLGSSETVKRNDLDLELDGINTNKTDFTDIDTSAEILAIVGDETGTGALVFGTAPDLTISATTETNIESAIDTLANLVSIQGRTVTLADAGANAFFGWDDTASAYENLTAAEAEAIMEPLLDTLANVTSIQGRTVTLADAGTNAFFGWDDTASAYENLTAAEAEAILEPVIDLLDLADGASDNCAANEVVRRNAGDTAFECAAAAGGSDGLGPDGDKGDVEVGGTGTTLLFSYDDDPTASGANECRWHANASGQIVCEGDTADTIETRIDVVDPTTSDKTFTIPNANSVAVQPITCTGSDKISSIDANGLPSCSVDAGGGGATLADGDYTDIVVSGTGTIMNIDASAVGPAEIATDAVSADELNATGVEAELEAVIELADLQGDLALGTKTSGNYVDDVTAGIGVAVTHTPAEGSDPAVALSFTDQGTDPALGAGGAAFSNEGASAAGLVFEGDTSDANETRLRITDPTAERIATIPNADSAMGQASTCTGTDKHSAFSATTGAFTCSADDDTPEAGEFGALALTGDVTSSGLATTIAANSVALATDTTGSFVQQVAAGVGIAVSGTVAEDYTSTVAFSFADAGADPALGAGGAAFSNEGASAAGVVFEGDTNDAVETRLRITDPTSTDKIATIPNADSAMAQAVSCGAGSKVESFSATTGAFTCTADDDTPEAGDFGALSATSPITQSGGTISTSIATARLVGRTTAGTGVMEQISVDATLSLATTTLGVVDVTCTGCLGATEIAALDAGDVTTGSFADARVDGSLEADELVLAGDIDGAANANDIDEANVEGELEGVLDLTDLQDAGTNTCTGSQIVRRNAGDTAFECATLSAPGDGLGSDGDKGDITVGGTGTTLTIDADAVALTTDTTGNYLDNVTAGTGISVTHTPAEGSEPQVAASTNLLTTSLTFVIDGGGATITTGIKGDLEIPFGCTVDQYTLLADQSGSIVIDVWKDTYANYPPVDADSMTGTAVPTISATTKAQTTTLTGWTTSVAAGDTLRFNVDSVTTIQRVTISLRCLKT